MSLKLFATAVFPLLLAIGLPRLARAQGAQFPLTSYSFAASQGTYTDLPFSGTLVRDIVQDDNESRLYPIGFSFVLAGTAYTQFVVDSNGWLSLGFNPSSASNNGFNVAGSGASRPLLAPLWDDLNGEGGRASFLVEGTAPNRTFTMEWRNWHWPASPTNASTISFQVKLFETTNVIQYCYRREASLPAAPPLSATIGVAGGGFLSLSDASAAPAVSTTVSTDNISERPATGQVYTFTPPTACPNPTGITATATSGTTASVSFVPGGNNPVGYVVQYIQTGPGGTQQTATGTTSPVLLTGLMPNTTYQILVFASCANGTNSSGALPAVYVSTPGPPNTSSAWTGAVSRAWDEPGNWTANAVPLATTNVTINATANQPLVTGSQACSNLLLRPAATLTLGTAAAPAAVLTTSGYVSLPPTSTLVQAAGSTLAVGTNWLNNGGTLTLAPTSRVAFVGGGIHALGGGEPTTFQNLSLGELTPGDELDLTAPVSVQRLLTVVESGFVQVQAGGSLRLLSNAQGTAQVVRDASGFVAGNVTAERELAGLAGGYAGAGQFLVAAPVRTATVGGLAGPGFAPVVNPNYNTSATPGSVAPQPTVFGYDQSRISTNADALTDFATGFFSPDALTDVLTPGLGYRLDAQGAATPAPTGPLTFNNVTRSGMTRATLPQSGYHLLGNPYAAALDWDVVAGAATTTGLDAAVHVYQPVSATGGLYRPYVNGVGGSRYLLPGQGFLVRVSAASTPANVTFTQAARYGAYYDPAQPPAAPIETRPLLTLALAAATGPADEATAYFQSGATASFDARYDAHKLPTSGVPYVAFAGAQPLAISAHPALGLADVTLPLAVRGPAAGTYTLTAARLLNLPAGTYAYLLDLQRNTATDLAQQPAYSFTLADAAVSSRFSLRFTRTQVLATAPAALARQLVLFPNPARGTATLEVPAVLAAAPLTATLRNVLGQVVGRYVLPAGPGPRSFSLAGVAPGVYSVQVLTPEGAATQRLLVE